MGKEYQEAWDQVALSREADERIRHALMAAQYDKNNVISLHKEEPSMHKAHKAGFGAVLAAVMILALSVTAFAAANYTGFFESVFGSKGLEDRESYEMDGSSTGDVMPGQFWDNEVDTAAAEAALGPYVTGSGRSVSAGGYTLAVDEVLIDSNGVGAISYTVSNPDGIPGPRMWGEDQLPAGQFNLVDDERSFFLMVYTQSGTFLDPFQILDTTRITDTEIHAIAYFQSITPLSPDDELMINFLYSSPETMNMNEESEYICIPVSNRAPCATFISGDDMAHLSPLSVYLEVPDAAEEEDITNYWAHNTITDLVIYYADGSEYVVYSSEPAMQNTISGGISGYTGQYMTIFNRFVDVENVTSLTCTRSDGTVLTFTPEA